MGPTPYTHGRFIVDTINLRNIMMIANVF